MFKINLNFLEIKEKYLFYEIAQIKKNLNQKNNKIIDMSIGDVTLPLDNNVIKSLHDAVDDMADIKKFKGYSPSQGYLFLRKAIKNKYQKMNVSIDSDDIFINDGAKSDLSNILDIFSKDNIVGIPSVCYPVYLDVCQMHGIKTVDIKSNQDNNFLPMPKDILEEKPDLIYLCSPNNPTGMAYNREQLKTWVNFAIDNNIIIFYDSAYQDFISQQEIPKTIYQIKNAKKCAIEICSFSKSAGFTGIRCGYTIFPNEIKNQISNNKFDQEIVLNKLWQRRQSTKFNGVSYLSQKAAESFVNHQNQKQINHCKKNLKTIKQCLDDKNRVYWGGVNSPYIWLKCPANINSFDYFNYLIEKYKVITTPGIGFGKDGENFIRISSFF